MFLYRRRSRVALVAIHPSAHVCVAEQGATMDCVSRPSADAEVEGTRPAPGTPRAFLPPDWACLRGWARQHMVSYWGNRRLAHPRRREKSLQLA